MTKNRISSMSSWSALEETVRFLHNHKEDHKVEVLHQQMEAMGGIKGNKCNRIYSPEVLVRAFSYYALSRSSYNRMREDYQLPSISTLNRLTSSCNKISTSNFLKTVLGSTSDEKKPCILLHD